MLLNHRLFELGILTGIARGTNRIMGFHGEGEPVLGQEP